MLCWSSCSPGQDVLAKISPSEQHRHSVHLNNITMFCINGQRVIGNHSKYQLMTMFRKGNLVTKAGHLRSEILTSLLSLPNKFATFPLLPTLITAKALLLTESLRLLEPSTRMYRTDRCWTVSKWKKSVGSPSRRSQPRCCTTIRAKTTSWTSSTPLATLTSAMRWHEAYVPAKGLFF